MQTEYLTFIVKFKVAGRFAYLSHQETLTFWRRVLVRAQIPLAFSQGYNPHPYVSLPLPRSVGVSSDCELLCARVRDDGIVAQDACEAIVPLLPDGCVLRAVEAVPGKMVFYPVSATYQFTLAAYPDRCRLNQFETCKSQLRTAEPVMVRRHVKNSRMRSMNICPFIESFAQEGQIVWIRCAIRPEGTARVDELMDWLGLEPYDLDEPVRRCAVRWGSDTKHQQGEIDLL